ncbi:TPA: hypothetical protein ACGO9S_000498, partial [Streptococcus suis]
MSEILISRKILPQIKINTIINSRNKSLNMLRFNNLVTFNSSNVLLKDNKITIESTEKDKLFKNTTDIIAIKILIIVVRKLIL